MSMRMMHAGEDFITCNLQGRSQVRRQLMKRQHEAFTACAGESSVIRETVGVALAQPGNPFTNSPTRRHVPCPVESAVRIALILVGGALGDSLGRRSMFLLGVASFAVASAGCGFSSSI